MLEAEFREVDPADCLPSDDEPVELRPDIGLLRENLLARGQMAPVLLAPHPVEKGKFQYIDGHGRGWCLAQLGRRMKALVFPRPLTPAELIEFKFSNNLIRRTMSPEEIGLETLRYIELTGCSQQDMAARLSISNATMSRCLARIKRIPEECEEMARQLGPSFVAIILSLKTPEQRRLAFEFATTKQADGRKPKRDQLARYVDGLKGKKPKTAARTKRLHFLVDGREYLVKTLPGDTVESLSEAFRAVANLLSKHKTLKLETVAAVLADKDAA
jgi:ParB-like chromosome segregation protein Spo0J